MPKFCSECGKKLSLRNCFFYQKKYVCRECLKKLDPTYGKSLKGVGGWLMLFCLSLTIFIPVMTFYNLYNRYVQFSEHIYWENGLKTHVLIDTVIVSCITILGIYTGIKLWRIRQGSLKFAKLFLFVLLAYSISGFFETSINEFIPGYKQVVIGQSLLNIIYFAIWYTYLSVSKRVWNTYVS